MRQVLGPGALGRPRGIGWRGWWEGGSGWGTHVCFIAMYDKIHYKKKKIKKEREYLTGKVKNSTFCLLFALQFVLG